jgi:hypothetical protein
MLARTLYPWRHLDELRHLRQEEIVKRNMNLALAILKTLEDKQVLAPKRI